MNHTVYRHLSIPWFVMRDGLRFMPEGSGKFEVVGHSGTVRRRWWSGRCGTDCWMTSDTDCFGDLQRVRTVAKQLRRQLGDDADHPTYILTEPLIKLQ